MASLLLALPALIAALSASVLAIQAYQQRQQVVFRYLGLFLLTVCIWCAAAVLEILSPSFSAKLFWVQVQYVGIAFTAATWLLFVLVYTDRMKAWYWRYLPWALLIPAVSLLLVWTNGWHQLIWQNIYWQQQLVFDYGWWFSWVYAPYQYLMIATGLGLLVNSLMTVQRTYYRQVGGILLASLLTPLVNLLYLFKLNPLPVDLTPVGFAMSCLVIYWVIHREHLAQRPPIYQHTLFKTLQDAVLILDKNHVILEVNPTAEALLDSDCLTGQHLKTVLPELPDELLQEHDSHLQRSGIAFRERHLYLSLSPLHNRQHMSLGYVLTLRDMTQKHRDAQLVRELSQFQTVLLELMQNIVHYELHDTFYQTVLDKAVAVIPGAEAGSVMRREQNGDFSFIAAVGFNLSQLSSILLSEHELIIESDRRPGASSHLFHNVAEHYLDQLGEQRFSGLAEAGRMHDIQVSLGIPVYLDKRLEAMIYLDNFRSPDAFNEQSRQLAEVFGIYLSALLQKNSLRLNAERAAKTQALLAAIERLMLEFDTLDDFFDPLAKLLIEETSLATCQISILELEETRVKRYWLHHHEPEKLTLIQQMFTDHIDVMLSKSLARKSLRSGEASYYPDVLVDENWIAYPDNPVRCALIVPLRLAGKPWGVIEFYAEATNAYSETDLSLLEMVASSLELALQRERDHTELEQQLARMNAAVSVSESLRFAYSHDEVYTIALDCLFSLTGADSGHILVYESDADVMRAVAGLLQGKQSSGINQTVQRGQGLSWSVVDSGTSLHLLDKNGLHNLVRAPEMTVPTEFIAVPIKAQENSVVAVLTATFVSQNPTLEQSKRVFMEAIAQATSAALVRIELLEQSRSRAADYEQLYLATKRQAQELKLLNQISTTLSQHIDLQHVIHSAVSSIAETFSYPLVSLYLIEDDSLVLQHQLGDEALSPNLSLTEGLVGSMVTSGQTCLMTDLIPDKPDLPSLTVPLLDDTTVVGVLYVASTVDSPLTEKDLQLMKAVAEQLSIALERSRLYQTLQKSEEQFRLLAENTRDLVSLHKPSGDIAYLSPSVTQVLGYKVDELLNTSPYDIIFSEDQSLVERCIMDAFHNDIVTPLTYRMRHKSGHYIWIESLMQLARDKTGQRLGLIVSSRDVTERKSIEDALRRNEEQTNSILQATPDLLLVIDANGVHKAVISGAEDDMLAPAQAMIGRSVHDLMEAEVAAGVLQTIRRALTSQELQQHEYPLTIQGKPRWFAARAVPLDWEGESCVLWVSRNISERKMVEDQLRQGALYDSLTGLPNRNLLMDRISHTLTRQSRRNQPLCAVLFLDLDRFKVINDSLGHAAGDDFLQEIARRLEQVLRPGDTVARLGGDEFCILLEELPDQKEALQIAARLQHIVAKAFKIGGREVSTHVSIGIAFNTFLYETAEDLLRDADIAMYHAKRQGKARTAVFDSSMHESALRQLDLETNLRQAIERSELFVVYQPIVRLHDQSLAGFEALVCWQHPAHGLVSPADFIPLAEETGLIQEIDLWVLQHACQQMAVWDNLYPTSNLYLSTNLSVHTIENPHLLERISSSLQKSGLPGERLRLEVTESTLMTDAVRGSELLSTLRQQGIRVQIDDFGTGYSSMHYLHKLPLDIIKIDRSFVQQLQDNDASIVRSIVAMAQALKLEVVAEGIETQWQLDCLRQLDCEYGQGYFFARPLSPKDAEDLYFRQNRIAIAEPQVLSFD